MIAPIFDWSRILHNLIFSDADQSFCARAYTKRNDSQFWYVWVIVFTSSHCERSFRFQRSKARARAKRKLASQAPIQEATRPTTGQMAGIDR